jgi:hypothetical protein
MPVDSYIVIARLTISVLDMFVRSVATVSWSTWRPRVTQAGVAQRGRGGDAWLAQAVPACGSCPELTGTGMNAGR